MDIAYTGSGAVAVQTSRLMAFPQWRTMRSTQVHRLVADIPPSDRGVVDGQIRGPRLAPGYYRARFEVDGPIWTTAWWNKNPDPIHLEVYARRAEGESPADADYPFDSAPFAVQDPAFLRPLAQRLQAPWWGAVPWYGHAFDLHFYLGKAQEVGFGIHYDGPESVHLGRG